jgi:hypothetical protein
MRMPVLVDEGALARVELELRRAAAECVIVLDFTMVRHIRYRDLQRFSRAVREVGPRPLRLVGLSEYCREIFRFALSPRDWEAFLEVEAEWPRMAARGNAAERGRAPGSRRISATRDGIPGGLPVPSPN